MSTLARGVFDLSVVLNRNYAASLTKPVETCLVRGHDQPALESLLAASMDESDHLRNELRIARDMYAGLREKIATNRSKWYETSANVAELIRWLVAEGFIATSDFEEIVSIVAAPQDWSAEYEKMRDVYRERNATSAL